MRKVLMDIVTWLLLFVTTCSFAQTNTSNSKAGFVNAKQQLESMLSGKDSLSYEKAIYLIENAYNENLFSYGTFQQILQFHTDNIKQLLESQKIKAKYHSDYFYQYARQTPEQYEGDFKKALKNWSIFTYITDTTYFRLDSSVTIYKLPCLYSTSDPMGTMDWHNTQVTHLLQTGIGNCFALSSLFKIFADRLQSDATLCTAPNHIYIRHLDEKGTRYNIDLASRSFPGAGTLQTLTYTTDEALKNNISLRKLTTEQSVALCLVYLAKGYEYKHGLKDDFMLQCAETALNYDSLNLNAMLLKAELLENRILQKNKPITQLKTDTTFKEYEKLITHLYMLGYREMPTDMKNILVKGWTRDSVQFYLLNHLNNNSNETRKASLSWGLFDEDHAYKPIEQYGRTLFDTKTNKICGFAEGKPLYNDYSFDPVVFAFNVDPLAAKFAGQSPYIFAGDKPIAFVDEDGLQESLSIRLRQYETGYLKGKYSKDDLIQAQRGAGFGGATGAVVAFTAWGLWEFTPTVVSGMTTTARVTQIASSRLVQTALGGLLYAYNNPQLANEAGAFVGGLFLPGGSQDLCPTCTGDELGSAVNATAQSAFRVLKGWTTRGNFLEGLAGAVKYSVSAGFKNLNAEIKNFKLFDFWNESTGTAVSYKTFNQTVSSFGSTINGYIKDLAAVTEEFTYAKGNKSYTLEGIKNKVLDVFVSDAFMNEKGSQEAIQKAITAGKEAGVTVNITNKMKQ